MHWRRPGFIFLAILAATLLLLCGCATTPVGVHYLDSRQIQQNITANILSSDTLSAPTLQILNRHNLARRFQQNPEEVLAKLHNDLPSVGETDRFFALAELSYACASRDGAKPHYLASAIYAYAFLFPQGGQHEPPPSDPRVRIAYDLYNRSLAEAFTTTDRFGIIMDEGSFPLPYGEITIKIDKKELNWGSFRFATFIQAAELDVRGLRNRYRWPGIGAPLAVGIESLDSIVIPAFSRVPPNLKVPVTAFLRIENAHEGLKSGNVRGNLEFYTTSSATTVAIDGREVPIEYETSSALAYTLEGSSVYSFELKGLFSGDFSIIKDTARFQDGIFFMEPYRPGLIPVVFIHGTASSPARWAEMLNELQNDRELWGRYQFWVFTYNTGNPITYSAGILAEGLRKVVEELDPSGKDPALREMVLIGHSQGGLLAKLSVVDSGTVFWDTETLGPFEEFRASPKSRKLVRRSVFFTPVHSVKRVIFISTPHKGSFIAGGWIGRLASRFIDLPFRVIETMKEITTLNPRLRALGSLKNIPRSTDDMDPESTFIQKLSSLAISPGTTAHSIISVKNLKEPKDKWTDGVVNYDSAHVDNVASELIVHSGHSTQGHPQTIEEVRRILTEHLKNSGQ